MGGHLGAGQFGGKVSQGWSSPGRGEMAAKLWPISVMAVVLRRPGWSGGDRGGEGALARS
jgi:hypothetical protein